jgi:hypothetical protein
MRVYSEKEIQALLRQAAALQAARRDPSNGLTLDEIRRIAEEAGIDATFVDQAAQGSVATPEPLHTPSLFWGGSYRVQSELTLDHEVDDDEWAVMVAEIRRSMGHRGQSEALGRGYDWRYVVSGQENAHVTLTPRSGRTQVDVSRVNQHVMWHMIPGMAAFFAALLGLIAAVKPEGGPPILVVLFMTVLAVGSFFSARTIFASTTRAKERKNAELLERLTLIAADSEDRRSREGQPARPLLDQQADALDMDGPPRAAESRRRTQG